MPPEPEITSSAQELPKAYAPSQIEEKWAQRWVAEDLFHVATPAPGDTQENFTILLPPPNVTGRLHMGHMFEQTETDVLIRWQRMRGKRALWVPGTDHAGIATQMLVERQLTAEGESRKGLGREKFLERVWEWKEHYGGAILEQMKRLGASMDWQREYFTMDDRLSRAVREAFVRLYDQGLIYRGAYIVNWCPWHQTALSDLEVVHEEQAGHLWQIRYDAVDGSGSLVVATTRPETMLGDTAVAVNPHDERYRHLHGKMLRLPLLGREIPVVTDDWADPEFGTGAVKVTPAHDPNDFAIGQRHNLPSINVMDESGIINDNGGKYAGLDRFDARRKILQDLEAAGQLVATKDHTHAVGRCDRCKTIVEPRLSLQWFVAVNKPSESSPDGLSMAARAIAAVEDGHIRITPDQHRKVYLEWMRNIHDWCISRQLWWGHRIPAWHCGACGKTTVARETPNTCRHCGKSDALTQETDVLDTWFSSGLLPFTVFGWPERTPDLAAFYPTQLLVTGFDILFFWVARMIMLGSHLMLEEPKPSSNESPGAPFSRSEGGEKKRSLRDAVPFHEVHIHALVRDADRQKMSKTKGNVVDPIQIIEKYGTDATRFTLAAMASPGTDIAFNEARTEGYRAFANKIWNAARFIFMQRDRAAESGVAIDASDILSSRPEAASAAAVEGPASTLEDRWITSRLSQTITAINEALEAYRFDQAADAAYQFFWGDFCDWYLEIVKIRLEYSSEEAKQQAKQSLTTLLSVFEQSLRLLSPFMPFITEELWQALTSESQQETSSFRPESSGVEGPALRSIALAPFPQPSEVDSAALTSMNKLQQLIVATRALRKDLGIPEKQLANLQIVAQEPESVAIADPLIIRRLARIDGIAVLKALMLPVAHIRELSTETIGIPYEKQIDIPAERARLTKDLAQQEKEWANNQRQLSNEAFLAKAPAKVVEGLRTRAAELGPLLEKTRAALAELPAEE